MTNPPDARPTPARAVRAGVAALAVTLAAGMPAATASPGPADEEALLALLNRERAAHGLAPLTVDEGLRSPAAAHAAGMAAEGRLFHSPVSAVPPPAGARAGENVAMAGDPVSAHRALLASDAHRRTMLDPGFRSVGIGVAHSPGGTHWIAMRLATAGTAAGPTVDAAGRVTVAPGEPHHGDVRGLRLAAPVVGIAVTPSGGGWWLAAADGGVFAFGDAPFLGSAATAPLPSPVVRIARTASGLGYALHAADGTGHAFGDAR